MPQFAHFVPHFEALRSMKPRLFALVEENRNKPRSGACPNDQLLAEKHLQTTQFKPFFWINFSNSQLLESSNLKTRTYSSVTLDCLKESESLVGGTCLLCCMVLGSCRPWQPASDKSAMHLILASTAPTSFDSMIAWHTSVLRTGYLNVFDMSWRLPR